MLEDFLTQPSKDNLVTLAVIYGAACVVLFFSQWASRRATGLPLAYALSFSMLHLVGALIYSLPDYHPRSAILLQNHSSLENTFYGFRVACLGFVMLVAGVVLARFTAPVRLATHYVHHPNVGSRLPINLLLMGILFFFFIYPILGNVASFSSLSIAGTMLTVIGVYMRCRQAWEQRKLRMLLSSLLMTLAFPAVTIIFMGFASYGSAMAATIWMLVICFVRPRWLSLLTLVGLLYIALSFYINWMAWREEIRSMVWGSQSIERRVDRVLQMVSKPELLDVSNQIHLEIMDLRLNQNDLVGKAVIRLENGRVEPGGGYSLWVAATSWIPRILWPGKPTSGGSGQFVTFFTGQEFAEGTSVGAGQALEFYANFGLNGAMGCFLLLGWLLGWLDCRISDCLLAGDWWSACRWLLPSLAWINPGGLMAESVSSFAASAVLVTLLHHALFRIYYQPVLMSQVRAPGMAAHGRRYPH